MKALTTKGLFRIFLTIFVAAIVSIVLLNLAKSYLPSNRFTHECKDNGAVLFNSLQEPPSYKQEFCQQNYHVEFKDSWDRSINNIAVPIALFSGLALIPAGSVLTFRKFLSNKK